MFEAPSGKAHSRLQDGGWLAHLSTKFLAAALQSPGLSTTCARSSRAPHWCAEERHGSTWVRDPKRFRGGRESRHRAQRNARRNLVPVASAACASTCDV